jgi:hypothetical protein
MRLTGPALTVLVAGVLTFFVVFAVLEAWTSTPTTEQTGAVAPASAGPTPIPVATDSLAPQVAPGQVAIGVPIAGSEPLVRDVHLGDRLDVLATVASAAGDQPVTAIVVRGATVLRPASGGDPLLLEVAAPQAVELAHLILGGTHLGYTVWSHASAGPSESPPLAEPTARALLGLGSASAQAPPASQPPPTPTPIPLASPVVLPGSGFLYQVQPGDTWDTVAAIFGTSAAELRQWNEAVGAADPPAGSLVFIPRRSS